MTDAYDAELVPGESMPEPGTAERMWLAGLPEAQWGRRGYDKAAVRRLLSRLAYEATEAKQALHRMQVATDSMASEIAHRRGGYLPDHSITEFRVTAQIDAMRHSDEVIRVAQTHARDMIAAAQQQAASLLNDPVPTEDVALLRQRLHEYQQLIVTMNDYIGHIASVLTSAAASFSGRLNALEAPQANPSLPQQSFVQ